MKAVKIFSAGSNAHGQLANGTVEDSHIFRSCRFDLSEPEDSGEVDFLSEATVVSVAAGANHTLVLVRRDGRGRNADTELWGCGDGRRGQLGANYLRKYGVSSVFRRIDLGKYENWDKKFACATWETSFVVVSSSASDLILSMGANDHGDLGTGRVDPSSRVCDGDGEVNTISFDHLHSAETIRVSEIKAGMHTVIVHYAVGPEEKERLAGWGAARHGQLGLASNAQLSPTKCVLQPTPISLSAESDDYVCGIALGSQHSAYIHSSGKISTLGSNRKGQLSVVSSELHPAFAVAATWNGTFVVQKCEGSWRIHASGSNTHGQLAKPPINAVKSSAHVVQFPTDAQSLNFLDMVCGSEHSMVLLQRQNEMKEVWGWGWNEHGNLGLNHTCDVVVPTRLWESSDQPEITRIWAGCGTSWIVTEVQVE